MAEITEVLERLFEHTGEGRIPWQPTSDEQTFIVVYGDMTAMIQVDEYEDTVLRILKFGNEIERLDSGDKEGGSSDWESTLEELHQMARRAALGVDKQLDELLEKMDRSINNLPF